MELPQKYLDSMKELLGDEFQAYLDSFSQKRLYGLRVNNLKISTEDFLKISPFKLKKIPWIDNGFYYEEDDKPAKHPYYFAGLYYLQEPSAMTPASILPIEHGDKVLDVCAAPGGKSTELGARLGGTGLLVSNDISASRAKALLKNIEVSGIGNVVITCEEPGKLISSFESFFDKILIDAPCSGEGMFRKDNKLIKSWQMNGPEYFAAIQKSILSQAAQMLKPGGYMLYSTCTFSKLEDEDNIQLFLESHPDFSLVDIFDSGIPSIHPYEGFSKGIGLPQCVRIFPHKMQGEGHFVALLKKDGEAIGNRAKIKVVKNKVAPPFREAEVDLVYGIGISREGDILDLAANDNIVNKSGAWYAYNGNKIGQGRENAKQYLKENPDIMKEIEDKVRAKRIPKGDALDEASEENVDNETAAPAVDADKGSAGKTK